MIVEAFGNEVVGSDGFIDRKKLGSIVFSNAEEMKKLTDITWPLIHDMASKEIQECDASVVVVEAAILLEAGWTDIVDEIWVVEVDRDVAIRRLKERNHLTEEECVKRLNSQWSNEKRASFANTIIYNNKGLEELKSEVDSKF